MIKVNLLNDISDLATKSTKKKFTFGQELTSTFATKLGNVAGDETRMLVTRAIVFAIPLILVFGYQGYEKKVAEDNLKRLQTEHQALQDKLASLEAAVKEVEKFQEEKKKLNAKLDVIKALSKERLKNVKSLDMLQSLIPSKAWLTSLVIKDKKIEFDGLAVDDSTVAEFMSGLGTSIYFGNVTLISSEEHKGKEGTLKKYKIRTSLENL